MKLNLFHLGQYTAWLDDLPAKMQHEITHGGWETNNDYAFVFDWHGKTYRKDPDGSFVFTQPNKNDAKLLMDLLKKELTFQI